MEIAGRERNLGLYLWDQADRDPAWFERERERLLTYVPGVGHAADRPFELQTFDVPAAESPRLPASGHSQCLASPSSRLFGMRAEAELMRLRLVEHGPTGMDAQFELLENL